MTSRIVQSFNIGSPPLILFRVIFGSRYFWIPLYKNIGLFVVGIFRYLHPFFNVFLDSCSSEYEELTPLKDLKFLRSSLLSIPCGRVVYIQYTCVSISFQYKQTTITRIFYLPLQFFLSILFCLLHLHSNLSSCSSLLLLSSIPTCYQSQVWLPILLLRSYCS